MCCCKLFGKWDMPEDSGEFTAFVLDRRELARLRDDSFDATGDGQSFGTQSACYSSKVAAIVGRSSLAARAFARYACAPVARAAAFTSASPSEVTKTILDCGVASRIFSAVAGSNPGNGESLKKCPGNCSPPQCQRRGPCKRRWPIVTRKPFVGNW
jgi:hypothetical protein